MVERYKSPVGDDTGDLDFLDVTAGAGAGHQILDASGVEELDVGEGEDLGEEGRREERGVLDDHVVGHVGVLFVGHAQLVQEELSRATHDHRREELTTQPGTTTCSVLESYPVALH